MKRAKNIFLLIVVILLCPVAANAGIISIAYDTGSGVLTADFEGTLQGDNDTFIVSSIIGTAQIDGVDVFATPFVGSLDGWFDAGDTFTGAGPAILTISGSYFDFLACPIDSCGSGFLFAVGNVNNFGYVELGGFGSSGSFDVNNWSATVSSSVPAPSVLTLLGIGLLGMGMARRRK